MIRNLQVILLLGITLFAGFAVTSVISYTSAHNSLEQETESRTLPMASSAIYNSLARDLSEPLTIASMMANNLYVIDSLKNEPRSKAKLTHYLETLQQHYPIQTSFVVSAKTLTYYHSSGVIKTISPKDPQDSWYFDFKNTEPASEINVDTDTADLSRTSVFINVKIMDHDKLLGITGVGLSLKHLRRMIDSYEARYSRRVLLVQPNGAIALGSSHTQKLANLADFHNLGKETSQTLLQTPDQSLHVQGPDGREYFNSHWMPQLGLYLVVEQHFENNIHALIKPLLLNLIIAILATLVVLWTTWKVLTRYRNHIARLALTDKLTGLNNRQLMDRELPMLMENYRQLCCLIVDIDHFKRINDTYGHICGDNLIHSLSRLFTRQIRQTDMVCRWGGDEFVFVLPACHLEDAINFAERLRQSAEDHEICYEERCIRVSLSLGLTQALPDDTPIQLLDRADQALLRAKSDGRNRMAIDDAKGKIWTLDPPRMTQHSHEVSIDIDAP